MPDLIYDLGLHDGQDSEFYLNKGFRVVGVEADPDLCRAASDRLRPFIESGRLKIINAAIAESHGRAAFYRSSQSDWSTVSERYNAQNVARGHSSELIMVDSMTLAELVRENGQAFYMKIDIEGMDRAALRSLAGTANRPSYLSMETSFGRERNRQAIIADFEALAELGYDRFKIVDQLEVPKQVAPSPPRCGKYVRQTFVSGSSGLFGEEAPGEWMSMDMALTWFRALIRRTWFPNIVHRHSGLYGTYCGIVHRVTGSPPNHAWFDIHAKYVDIP